MIIYYNDNSIIYQVVLGFCGHPASHGVAGQPKVVSEGLQLLQADLIPASMSLVIAGVLFQSSTRKSLTAFALCSWVMGPTCECHWGWGVGEISWGNIRDSAPDLLRARLLLCPLRLSNSLVLSKVSVKLHRARNAT